MLSNLEAINENIESNYRIAIDTKMAWKSAQQKAAIGFAAPDLKILSQLSTR